MLSFGLNARLPKAFVTMGSTRHPSNSSKEDSRVNEKSSPPPRPPPPTRGGSLGTVGRVHSWGRGLRSGTSGGSSNKKKMNRGVKKSSSWTFRDDLYGTASTFSPSDSDFSLTPSTAFLSRRSRRSSSMRFRASSQPSSPGQEPDPYPETSLPPKLRHCDSTFNDPVPEEPSSYESSSLHSITGDLLEPHSPSPTTSTPSSALAPEEPLTYELTRNERDELGFMEFQFVLKDASQDEEESSSSSSEAVMAQALELSQATLKPILRYQSSSSSPCGSGHLDVPAKGWECAGLGSSLSSSSPWLHPLIAEAAESLFVTVHVDGGRLPPQVHHRQKQPALEFLDGSGSPLIPALSPPEARSRGSVTRAMIRALEAGLRPVPRYLQIVSEEESGRIETAAFGVADDQDKSDDPARGEAEFPALSGVISTRSGMIDGCRVVEVSYDGQRLSFGCLVHFALKRKAGGVVYYRTNDERVAAQVEIERVRDSASTRQYSGMIQLDCDPKPALRRTPLRFVPLTGVQAARANRFARLGRFDEAVHLLSPRQGLILMKTMQKTTQKNLHDVIDVPILPAWISVCEKRDPRAAAEELGLSGDDDPSADEFAHPPSYYEYNNYSSALLPPGYPWRGF